MAARYILSLNTWYFRAFPVVANDLVVSRDYVETQRTLRDARL